MLFFVVISDMEAIASDVIDSVTAVMVSISMGNAGDFFLCAIV